MKYFRHDNQTINRPYREALSTAQDSLRDREQANCGSRAAADRGALGQGRKETEEVNPHGEAGLPSDPNTGQALAMPLHRTKDMTKKIIRTPATPAKMIPAVVVLTEASDRFKKIEAVLGSMDSMFAAIEDDSNDWARGMSYIATGVRDEIKEVREYLDRMVISGKDGSALGIEKGGK
jgi:hypothetical protein